MGTDYGRGLIAPAKKADSKTAKKTISPPKYEVYLINDDYTPMEFVVIVLQHFFAMNYAHAFKVMMEVHLSGLGICGIYTRDIAETKVAQVNEFARLNEHPLLCKMKQM